LKRRALCRALKGGGGRRLRRRAGVPLVEEARQRRLETEALTTFSRSVADIGSIFGFARVGVVGRIRVCGLWG
jgi:hypothetical protein